MDANQITFGIEIETTMPAGYQVGGYHGTLQAAGLPTGWTAQHDGSIRATRGRVGCEFVSPVLSGSEGIKQVIEVVRKLRQIGAQVNQSTGLHVHIGFDRAQMEALDRLITLTANFERAIYASTGTKSRELGSYCGSIQSRGSVGAARQAGRYQILNLVTHRPTVEFRAFAGTLNESKIIGYIRLCIGLAERAIKAKRITTWVAKTPVATSPIARRGEGQTALTRLFYQLGWHKGRTDYTYGNIIADGAPSITDNKRILMKMARKYDGRE